MRRGDMIDRRPITNTGAADIDKLIANLERNGMTALGEHGDIDLAKARQILELAL